jgi:hypothetical protein
MGCQLTAREITSSGLIALIFQLAISGGGIYCRKQYDGVDCKLVEKSPKSLMFAGEALLKAALTDGS